MIPSFEAFSALYQKGKPQIVWRSLAADLDTPVSAMLKLAAGTPNSFLLESVEGGASRGRYSFLGMKPDLIWRCRGNLAEINRKAESGSQTFSPCPVAEKDGVLASLRSLVNESRIDIPDSLPPMAAGLVGYMSYDTIRLVEDFPDANPDPVGVPDGIFVRPTIMAVFDTIKDTVTIITPVRPSAGVSAEEAYAQAGQRLDEIVAAFDRPLSHLRSEQTDSPYPTAVPRTSRDQFHQMVEKAKEYILAGDIFQVVLSQRFTVPFTLPPFALYRSLRRTNPSPFLFFLDFGEFSLVGSSPEILVRLRDETVTIRPLAGTRKRGANATEDAALAADLLADTKELAEHLMLLDLGRNDVGRVSQIGSVKVTEKMAVEYYSHVMHIVSNVEGKIRPECDAIDALMAGFPAGTVSGAPKVRAMEIIDELESDRRGFYAGCIGYFAANGSLDTCIALRTALVKDGVIHIQAGAGIVADSDPEAEYQETWNKAQALLRAAEEAVHYKTGRETA